MAEHATNNARRQAAWRARRDAKLVEQAKEIARLKRKVAALESLLRERE
jgi:hypothetical protein